MILKQEEINKGNSCSNSNSPKRANVKSQNVQQKKGLLMMTIATISPKN